MNLHLALVVLDALLAVLFLVLAYANYSAGTKRNRKLVAVNLVTALIWGGCAALNLNTYFVQADTARLNEQLQAERMP